MNIIDVILLAIIALAFISGMQKGFLASLLAAFGFVGAWFASKLIYPSLAARFISSDLYTNWLPANPPFSNLIKALGDVKDLACQNVSKFQLETINAALADASVPEAVSKAINTNILTSASTGSQFAGKTVLDCLNTTIWQSTFNVVSFLIVFAICYAVIILVVNLFNNMFRFPKLRGVDALLGGVFGALRGYVTVCLLVASLPLLFTALGSNIIENLLEGSALGAFFTGNSSFADIFNVAGYLEGIASQLH